MKEIKFRCWNGDKIRGISKNDYFSVRSDGLVSMNLPSDFEPILMQYTGLKDKNGVDIYESDLLQNYGGLFVIEFLNGCFGYRKIAEQETRKGKPWVWAKEDGNFSSWSIYVGPWEVIGNIHQNAELLK